jgi:hypothetical protein
LARAIVEIVEQPTTVSLTDQKVVVELGSTGPQGPKGDSGEVLFSDLSFVFEQVSASTTWLINHNLNFVPNITVVDSAGTVVEGSYSYPNSTSVILNFSNAFAGKAYLS